MQSKQLRRVIINLLLAVVLPGVLLLIIWGVFFRNDDAAPSDDDTSPTAAKNDSDIPESIRNNPDAMKQWAAMSEKEKAQTREILTWMAKRFEAMGPSDAPAVSEYDPTPAPVNISPDAFDQTLQRARNSLAFLDFHFKNAVRAEVDTFMIPNGAEAKIDIDWTTVLDNAGQPILDAAASRKKPQTFSGGYIQKLTLLNETVVPRLAKGNMTVTAPIQWAHFSFSHDELNTPKRIGDIEVTLRQCENNFFELAFTGAPSEAEAVFFARDRSGRRLDRDASSQRMGRLKAHVKGVADRVEFFVPLKTHTVTLPIMAGAGPQRKPDGRGYVAPAFPRYQPETPPLTFAAMTAGDLKQQTRTRAARSDAQCGFNTPEVQIILPAAANSAFSTMFKEDPVLSAADGSTVDCDVDWGVLEETGDGFIKDIRFKKPAKSPTADTPLTFQKARGKVRVRYPLEIQTVTLTRENPKANGLEAAFNGPSVEVRPTEGRIPYGMSFNKRYASVKAYDATGRRLAKSEGVFWGTPTKVVVAHVIKEGDVDIPFDLPPAPLLPKPE